MIYLKGYQHGKSRTSQYGRNEREEHLCQLRSVGILERHVPWLDCLVLHSLEREKKGLESQWASKRS